MCMACTSVEKIRASLGLRRQCWAAQLVRIKCESSRDSAIARPVRVGGVPVGGAWPFTRLDFPGRPARNACSRALRDIPSRESFQLWCTCCVSPSRPTCDLLRSNPLYVARGQANRCFNR